MDDTSVHADRPPRAEEGRAGTEVPVMFGPEYFTIAGWYAEDRGTVVCTGCLGASDLPRGMRGLIADDGTSWVPMMESESESWEGGLTCDDGSSDCSGYIFEPAEDYCLEHQEWRDSHDADEDCGYYKED